MTLLPEITFGGEVFYDISGIVTADRFPRPGTDGIAIHHSVGQTEFPDRNANGTSLDEQIAHVVSVNQFHVDKGYGGFGYNAIAFRDGTVFTVGNALGARAHVAWENTHLAGICMAGTFTDEDVPLGLILGVGRFLAACSRMYGHTAIKGHRDWVDDSRKPQWATACPGDKGVEFIGKMVMTRDALLAGSSAAIETEIKRKIGEALSENARTANLEGLAAQIKFLSGGKWC
jgi:hypothetical protein